MEENLIIYNQLRSVPKTAQKAFNNGKFSGTDINPMWRIKRMTEIFGCCGVGWYTEIVSREMITATDGTTMATFIAINLYVKIGDEWSKPIYGEGGNTFISKTSKGYMTTSDEAYKMAYTDAFSNATKQLGLGADIWFEKDVTKYTGQKIDVQSITPQEITRDYLMKNEKALQYYFGKYPHNGDIEHFSSSELLEIYNELVRAKKI